MDILARKKRGDRVVRGIKKKLFVNLPVLPGFLLAVAMVKMEGNSWSAFGVCIDNCASSVVTELENLSYHSYDFRSSTRLSIAHALAVSCSDIITTRMTRELIKKRGEALHVVKKIKF